MLALSVYCFIASVYFAKSRCDRCKSVLSDNGENYKGTMIVIESTDKKRFMRCIDRREMHPSEGNGARLSVLQVMPLIRVCDRRKMHA